MRILQETQYNIYGDGVFELEYPGTIPAGEEQSVALQPGRIFFRVQVWPTFYRPVWKLSAAGTMRISV